MNRTHLFLYCKHKRMMKSRALPDKFGVWLPIEFHGFTSRINSKGYHCLVSGLISIFLETVWVPLIDKDIKSMLLQKCHSRT